METRRINKLVMFLAVCKHCSQEESAEAVQSVPGFSEVWNNFLVIVGRLRRRSRLVLKLTSMGTTEDKANLRTAVATEAAKLSAALVTLAEIKKNADLAHSAHVTKSMLLNGRDVEAAYRADSLLEFGQKHAQGLEHYGITAKRIEEFDDLAGTYSELIGRPRAIIAARRRANRSLPTLFADADTQLAHMDRLAVLLEDKHADFVDGYRESRRIVNVSASRALSEVEKANAAAREAKQDLKKAKEAAERDIAQAELQAKLESDQVAIATERTKALAKIRGEAPVSESDSALAG